MVHGSKIQDGDGWNGEFEASKHESVNKLVTVATSIIFTVYDNNVTYPRFPQTYNANIFFWQLGWNHVRLDSELWSQANCFPLFPLFVLG